LNIDEIEKLRPLANNTKHLITIILDKMIKEGNNAGHEMFVSDIDYFYDQVSFYAYCKTCTYEIEIYFFEADIEKQRIYVKETGY